MWIKNTSGKRDAALTFATLAFFTVTINLFLSTYAGYTSLSPEVIGTYLGITFTSYIGRRLTDKAYEGKE